MSGDAIVHRLHRTADLTGVSGIGTVADLIELPGGMTVVRWRGPHTSTVIWPGGLVEAMHVHGHQGTELWTAGHVDGAEYGLALGRLERVARETCDLMQALLDPAALTPPDITTTTDESLGGS